MTVYHPGSGRLPDVQRFDTYGCSKDADPSVPPPDSEPWRPFTSRINFEVAELAAEAHLNQSQTVRLLEILNKVAGGHSGFSLSSYADLESQWKEAEDRHPKVTAPCTTHDYI